MDGRPAGRPSRFTGAAAAAAGALRGAAVIGDDRAVIELERNQAAALVVAAATCLLALTVSPELGVRVLIGEIGCLTFILCGEMVGRFIGLGITQETPGCFVVAAGWTLQVLLFLAIAVVAVGRLLRR